MKAVAQAYRYARPSMLEPSGLPRLSLATSSLDERGAAVHPHFFEGRLLQPRLYAELLVCLGQTSAVESERR